MTNQQKIDKMIECAVRIGEGKTSNKSKVEELRADLLRELAASQPGEPGKARGNIQDAAQRCAWLADAWALKKNLPTSTKEGHDLLRQAFEDELSQFFRPSAPSPQPQKDCNCGPFGHEPSCPGVAPSGSAGQEPPPCDCNAGSKARLYEHHRDCHWLQYVSAQPTPK